MKTLRRVLLLLLLIIAVTGIYFWIKFSGNNQEKLSLDDAARKNATGQFIKLTGGITHYQSGGADTGKVIILVHGFSVPFYIWDATYDSLVQNGFRVIRYDAFGRGYSDRPDVAYDPALYRTQLYDIISSLKLKTPVCLAGLSFGGLVVADFVVNYPKLVDKIVFVDPVYTRAKLEDPEFVTNYEMALEHEKQAQGQLDDVKYPGNFPGWVDKYKVQMKYKGFRHALISTRKNYFGGITVSNYQRLGALNKKVLLIWGKEDVTVPFNFSDSIRRLIKLDFVAVEDARHLPHLEKTELVNRKIVMFLKE